MILWMSGFGVLMTSSVYFKVVHITQLKEATDDALVTRVNWQIQPKQRLLRTFISGLLCYPWLSFHCHESSLHTVFTWLLLIVCFLFVLWVVSALHRVFIWFLLIVCFCYFLWVVFTCVLICLVLLLGKFPSLIFLFIGLFSLVVKT